MSSGEVVVLDDEVVRPCDVQPQDVADAVFAHLLAFKDADGQRLSAHFTALPTDPLYLETIAVPQCLESLRGATLPALWAGFDRIFGNARHYHEDGSSPVHHAAEVLEFEARQKYLEVSGEVAPPFTLREHEILSSILARCLGDGRFLAIVSFWIFFGESLSMPVVLDFHQLAMALCNPSGHMPFLQAVHVHLMRKIGKTVNLAKWPQQLCRIFTPWAVGYEYHELTVRDRLGLLEALQLAAFDDNEALQKVVRAMTCEDLRPQAFGADKSGHRFWLVHDAVGSLLLYKELPTAELVCLASNVEDLELQLAVVEVDLSDSPPLWPSSSGCTTCRSNRDEASILLCDKCDRGYHLSCLQPPLEAVPDGDWACPMCSHAQLVEVLRNECALVARKRAAAERARTRLHRGGLSLANIVGEGAAPDDGFQPARARRDRKPVNYSDMFNIDDESL